MSPLLIGDLGTPELVVILAVVMLVFGGSKLPELARGSGRALRIFKAEVSATDDPATDEARAAEAPSSTAVATADDALPAESTTGTATATAAPDLAARQAAELEALAQRHAAERRAEEA